MVPDESVEKARRKSFGLIVVFALIVQAVVTLVWNRGGRENVSLPSPILSLLFLMLGMLGFFMGMMAVYYLKIMPMFDFSGEFGIEEKKE